MRTTRYPSMGEITPETHTAVVRDIFNVSSGRYDFLNHLLSLRRDVGWRACAVEHMRLDGLNGSGRLLDVATGTADLAIAAARRYPGVRITGLDFARPMLEVGRRKVQELGLSGRIDLLEGDALSLPFPDATFDVCSIAFGMRNIPDKRRALREMARVTVPGGRVLVLEMAFDPSPAFRPWYGFYLSQIMPAVARLFVRHGATYTYLADSIRHFPRPPVFDRMMLESGFSSVTHHGLTFGSAFLHIGRTKAGGGRTTRHGAK